MSGDAADATVCFVFRKVSGVHTVPVPWMPGKSLKLYFRAPELAPHGLISLISGKRMVDGARKRYRLSSTLTPGAVIFFVHPLSGFV